MEKKKKVSMKQIAERLNISSGAVSLTLNGRGDEMRIAAETQKLILDTAKEMGYPLERVRKKQQTVGITELPVVVIFVPVLTGDIVSPYDRIMNGLNQGIREDEVNVEILVCPFEYGKLAEKYRYISKKFCSGAIIFSMSEADMDELQKQEFDVPVVVFNRLNEKYPTVYVDDYNVGYQVAKMFQEKGCRKVALFTPDYKNKPILLRKMGFEAGCSDFGVELSDCNNIVCKTEHKEIEQHITRILESGQVPDMYFANMDDLGVGIILSLREKGIHVPQDVQVVSYGDHAWTKAVAPAMSSIRLDVEGMSRECLKMLWNMISSGDWTPMAKIFQQGK